MDIPTATVSEANGEISCSVEETNRIRAALGLKPLSTGGADGGSGKVEVDARVDRAQLRQQEELRDRIERARMERLRSQEASARGLGDVLKAGALSAADWVALSRQKDAADKAHGKSGSSAVAASRAAPRGHGGNGTAGVDADLVVSHSADDFAAGEAAVLTLRDRGLLDGDDLADGTDELVNVDRAERERAAALQERRKRAKLPVYDGLDDEEFGDGAGGGSGSRMLRQYDGEEGDDLVPAAMRSGGGLVIKAGGLVEDVAAQRRDGARRAAAGGRAADDVSGARGSSTVVSDFYTPSELAAQRAARGGKKPRSMRKAAVADADDVPAAAGRPQPSAGGVLSEIAASAVQEEPSERDRGSRANRGGGAVALQAAEEAKRMAAAAVKFDSAVARATEQSAALLSAPGSAAEHASGAPAAEESARPAIPTAGAPPAPAAAAPSNLNAATKQRVYSRLRDSGAQEGVDDDDAELAAVLARARRMAQAKAATAAASAEGGSDAQPVSGGGSAADRAASYVARAVTATSRHQQQQESAADASAAAAAASAEASEGGGSDGEGGGSSGGMVFNSITEFSHLLQARVSEQADAAASAAEEGQAATAASAAAAATATRAEGVAGVKRRRTDYVAARSSDPHIVEGSTWVDEAGEAQGGRGDDDDDGGDGTDDDDDDEEEDEEGFGRDANLGRGAAGALSLFARGGALHAKTAFVGRSKDARMDYTAADTLIAEGPAAGHQVVLEYKDEHGNLLTSKQAYRELCYRFHGRKPSQKTRDKRMRQNSREQRLAHAPTADTPLGSLSALQRAQEARGAAGLVMSHGR